jgi:hypothetical protein
MNISTKSRLLALLAAMALITAAACADSTTAPMPRGARAARDTMIAEGDTTLCRSGWQIIYGKVVCNEM